MTGSCSVATGTAGVMSATGAGMSLCATEAGVSVWCGLEKSFPATNTATSTAKSPAITSQGPALPAERGRGWATPGISGISALKRSFGGWLGWSGTHSSPDILANCRDWLQHPGDRAVDRLNMPPKASTRSIVCWREEAGNRHSELAGRADLSFGTGRLCLRNGYKWMRNTCQVKARSLL